MKLVEFGDFILVAKHISGWRVGVSEGKTHTWVWLVGDSDALKTVGDLSGVLAVAVQSLG
jgi:hypothetical protein